jgi:MoxR-like ATPase
MFNIWVDYPSFQEEVDVVKATTTDKKVAVNSVMDAEEIKYFQQLVRKVPVTDNVMEYAVNLTAMTRPEGDRAPQLVKDYISWGAGPRASQYLILGAKCHALINGKYAPDNEDVRAVATPILRHRMVKNYKAEAEGYSIEKIIDELKNQR